jgi:hypothetical protein
MYSLVRDNFLSVSIRRVTVGEGFVKRRDVCLFVQWSAIVASCHSNIGIAFWSIIARSIPNGAAVVKFSGV